MTNLISRLAERLKREHPATPDGTEAIAAPDKTVGTEEVVATEAGPPAGNRPDPDGESRLDPEPAPDDPGPESDPVLDPAPTTAPAPLARDATVRPPVVYLPDPVDPPATGERDTAHFGPDLDRLIRIARGVARPEGYGEEYDLIRTRFDFAHYFLSYRDIFRERMDPVAHYIRAGAREMRDPTPTFSTRRYRANLSEDELGGLTPFGHWLTAGAPEGCVAPLRALPAMAAVLDRPAAEVEATWTAAHRDVVERFHHGTLGEMVGRATALDPLVALSWPEVGNIRIGTFNSDLVMSRTVALHALAHRAELRRARAVVVVNRPRWGGGRRMEGHLAHALADIHGAREVLVLTTEQGGEMPPGKLPAGTRHVDMSDLDLASPELREQVLCAFLRILRPDIVFNVNSRLMWDAMTPFGRTLSQEMALVAGLFCEERTAHGHETGYTIHRVYRHFDILAAICTDSAALRATLCERYLIPPDQSGKLRVLRAPVDPSIRPVVVPGDGAAEQARTPFGETAADAAGEVPDAIEPDAVRAAGPRRPQVFWSGRLDPQKRVDLVYAIAREMPEVEFRLWGERVLTRAATRLPPAPENVVLEGRYERFADLPLQQADLWLYTSAWDGVPSVLLEVAMTGLPIVGTLVGGTGEILKATGARGVPADAREPGAYVEAIRETLADRDGARRRALALREELVAERRPEAYRAEVAAILEAGRDRTHRPDAPVRLPAARARPAEAPPEVDLSLLLTVHAETLVAGPTMRSAEAALARVEARGYRVERLMGLDAAGAATRAYMAQPAFARWTRHDLDLRDQGQARNALVRAARGRWIALLDADDLFSENWLEAALARLAGPEAGRAIVHPEAMWQFDKSQTIYTNPDQSAAHFSPWHFAMQNYYDALCVAPRAAWLEVPYADRDVARGYAYEDWQWGVETMAAGWRHVVARDTVIFKRRRDVSQSRESRERRVTIRPVASLAIDAISGLGTADRTGPPSGPMRASS
ncbi:glycosyltransferase [uncultured Jannaschia sp.]|uniref:glycosyltransferase n=1 Tax=uncultured Jannaschia sp. TaxID=293347 RepID=UPI00260592B7|nr:glycosyltransferase [uncultured Jannaschia sp.]